MKSFDSELLKPYQTILDSAIQEVNPTCINCLFSGGYDSMIVTHILHRLNTYDIPLNVWAVDTNLSADGWREFVTSVATSYGWNFQIYDNKLGFLSFLANIVLKIGLPNSPTGHMWTFGELKGHAFDKIHKKTKGKERSNKTLFISGMRRDESPKRANTPILKRQGKRNIYWLSLIAYFTERDCYNYRIINELPDNPFYDTVMGSGDCQCNWANFISYEVLKRYSPSLAGGNVAIIDSTNRYFHKKTWDGKSTEQLIFPMLEEDYKEPCKLTTPFLCQGCSRKKHKPKKEHIEKVYLQRGFL